jgi:hypothetical protein
MEIGIEIWGAVGKAMVELEVEVEVGGGSGGGSGGEEDGQGGRGSAILHQIVG